MRPNRSKSIQRRRPRVAGAPSTADFIRSLSVSASSGLGFGQSNPDVITGSGFANADMRGQGSNGSLVLFNGRRMASTNGGFGADINTIPSEVLQSGRSPEGRRVGYATARGAVGGVINFTTRRDIDAPQVSFETTLYDGSSSYKADFLTGWVGDACEPPDLVLALPRRSAGSHRALVRDASLQHQPGRLFEHRRRSGPLCPHRRRRRFLQRRTCRQQRGHGLRAPDDAGQRLPQRRYRLVRRRYGPRPR